VGGVDRLQAAQGRLAALLIAAQAFHQVFQARLNGLGGLWIRARRHCLPAYVGPDYE